MRLDHFECSGKKVVLYLYCDKLVKEETKRSKYLSGNWPPWVTIQRPEGDALLNGSEGISRKIRHTRRF